MSEENDNFDFFSYGGSRDTKNNPPSSQPESASRTTPGPSPTVPRPAGYAGPLPVGCGPGNYYLAARTQEEEDAFDFLFFRNTYKNSGYVGSVAHLVKGALGAGILSGHVAFMKGGLHVSTILTILFGIYITYCLHLLVKVSQILNARMHVSDLSYSDVGEACLAHHPSKRLKKLARPFRFCIDIMICIDLFGSCAAYQLIIAKTVKQIVEGTQTTGVPGIDGYPNLRVYLAVLCIPFILICLITHLKYLAPFSLVANLLILLCIFVTMYYAFVNNPTFTGMEPYGSVWETIVMLGMTVFSMSCVGIVIPVTNNMHNPKKYKTVVVLGMMFIITMVIAQSFFGYAAYRNECQSPITINFPLTILPIALKGMMAFMILVTHGINFFVPFNLVFTYIKPKFPKHPLKAELLFRALFVVIINVVAIIFPNINSLLGFLGAFCLSNMAFIWPCFLELIVLDVRPGYGKFRWRLIKGIILMLIGFFLMIVGSIVNAIDLMTLL